MKKAPIDRFLEKVQIGPLPVEWTGKPEDRTECLLWTAYLDRGGYGRFGVDYKIHLSHRWIYEKCIDLIPKGLELDHLCRVRRCVNPLHLEPVTKLQNVRRSPIIKESSRKAGLRKRKDKLPEGVTFHGKKFQVKKWDPYTKKTIYIGAYKNSETASRAYYEFINKKSHE